MKINKHNFKEYGVRILEWTYQPFVVSRDVFQPDTSLVPHLGPVYPQPKPMQLVLEFTDQRMISDFMAELLSHDENIIDLDDGYLYIGWLSTSNSPVELASWGWYRVNIPLLVIQTSSERAILLNKASNEVIIQGNWQTECRYEITPKSDLSSFTVNGITVKNLKGQQKLTIDGVEKRIYSDSSTNKYSDTTLKDKRFPVLSPGLQTIQISNTTPEVWLFYRPIYV